MKYSVLFVLVMVAVIQTVAGAERSIRKALLISSIKKQLKRYPRMKSERFLSTKAPSPRGDGTYSTKAPSSRGDGTYSTKAPSPRGDGTYSTKAPSQRGDGTLSTKAPSARGASTISSTAPSTSKGKGTKSPSSKGKGSKSPKGSSKNPSKKGNVNIGGLQSSAFSMQTMTKITSTVVAVFWFLM